MTNSIQSDILIRHASCTPGSVMTDNLFGDKATDFGNRELVFEWRPLNEQQQKNTTHPATKWLMYGLILALVALVFWLIWLLYTSDSHFAAKAKALTWHDLGDSLARLGSAGGLVQLKLLLYGVVAASFFWGRRMQRGNRLYLSHATLRQRSGLPLWLGNLLRQNWTLSLDEFRSGRAVFTLTNQIQQAGLAQAPSPLAMHVLRWKAANATMPRIMPPPQLLPASWFLIGQEARKPLKAPPLNWRHSLNPWATPEGQAALQNAFDQLPLVAALRMQGVPLPPVSNARLFGLGEGGLDLMAYPRMKAVVLGFFGLLTSAALAFHFTRHQHYFEPPPLLVWVAVGACCALVAWGWQAAEQQAPGEPSLKPTQGILAALLGVGAAFFAPFALLGASQAFTAAQDISVTVSHFPLQLQPEDKRIPAFSPEVALEFWSSLPANTRRQMTVHQGLFDTWQYDSAPLQDEVEAFYRQHGRR